MTVGYSMPDQLYKSRNGVVIDAVLGWFLVSLWCYLRIKAHWNRYLSSIFIGFTVAFLYLSHLGGSIYNKPIGSFMLPHLIFNLPSNLELNPLPSVCLPMSLYSFVNDSMTPAQQIHQDRFLA